MVRFVEISAKLDARLYGRKRTPQQRFIGMMDGSTNVYMARRE